MRFSELIENSKSGISDFIGEDFEVKGLAYDSRKIKPGYVFFALKGFRDDGTKYIDDAFNKGAAAVICDGGTAEDRGGQIITAMNARRAMALMSSAFFNNPSGKLRMTGITGTNGKTTTAFLTKAIFEHAGIPCGLIGTINYEYGDVIGQAGLTTPDSIELNMLLSEMADAGMKHCVMEVSSIALVMERVYGIKFSTAVFTNLTSEHLDFHRNMEEYLLAKKILFDGLSREANAVTNNDDEYGSRILSDTQARIFTYSVFNPGDLTPRNLSVSVKGISFEVTYNGKTAKFISKLTGRFNVYNILSAAAAGICNGIELTAISEAVSKFEAVKGRFNRLHLPNGATAVVDYSHTSDSLRNAIESARDLVRLDGKNGKVITVFGCGGNKDRTKRPVMGKLAVTLSDYAIITSDNPRYEDPNVIIDEIISGTNGNKNFEAIEDREQAIRAGIELSREGDIVLICGKGHEDYQEIMGVRKQFDDIEMVTKYSNNAGAR